MTASTLTLQLLNRIREPGGGNQLLRKCPVSSLGSNGAPVVVLITGNIPLRPVDLG